MPETVILCGEAAARLAGEDPIRLALSGTHQNITLKLEDISERMLAGVPDVLTDLLEVATYIYCADQLVSRGGDSMRALGADWRRRLRLVIPVREPDHWSGPIADRLSDLISFMSDDEVRFEFERARDPPRASAYLGLARRQTGREPTDDEICLFSGGLDSLAGAAVRLARGDRRLLLVGHRPSTKIERRQRDLASALGARYPGRVLHIPVRIAKRGLGAVDNTQRTRSLLFAAIGAVVARLADRDRLTFFENGIVSFNLPIAEQVVGARATRSTHPRVVSDLSQFLSALVGSQFKIDHPFLWLTKREVVTRLSDAGHADLAPHTVSCSSVYGMTRLHTHCGRCSQCLDRRFAMLAAGLERFDPQEMYAVDLFSGARDAGHDRTMAEAFVRHAREMHQLDDIAFVGRFGGHLARAANAVHGMTADQVVRSAIDLHRRHGAAVVGVLEHAIQAAALELAEGTLPDSCLLRMAAGGVDSSRRPLVRDRTEVAPTDPRFGIAEPPVTAEICLAVDQERKQVLVRGIPALKGPAAFALLGHLARQYEQDRNQGRAPENHAFIESGDLCGRLNTDDDALRSRVLRVRRKIAQAFDSHAGLPLRNNAVIESRSWKGYRLNPSVRVVAPSEINPHSQRHDC